MDRQIFRNIFIFAAALTLLDQFSKFFLEKYEWLSLTANPGIAFGIPMPNIAVVVATLILIPIIIIVAIKELSIQKTITQFALALILGGALGNLIDRLTHGYVIDFISIWEWPSFNLADAFITAGIFLLIMGQVSRAPHNKQK